MSTLRDGYNLLSRCDLFSLNCKSSFSSRGSGRYSRGLGAGRGGGVEGGGGRVGVAGVAGGARGTGCVSSFSLYTKTPEGQAKEGRRSSPSPARRSAQGPSAPARTLKPLSPAAQLLGQRVKRLSAGLGPRLDPQPYLKHHASFQLQADNSPAPLPRLGWEEGEPPAPPAGPAPSSEPRPPPSPARRSGQSRSHGCGQARGSRPRCRKRLVTRIGEVLYVKKLKT